MIINDRELVAEGKYYIGLMSGTSADGIDLALVDFTSKDKKPQLVASYYQCYSDVIAEKITSLYQAGSDEIDRAFHLDVELAQLFSQAVIALLNQENLSSVDIIAIGSHGQTIRHRPSGCNPYTLQIGCCHTLATLTGIRVVGQFRRKDMALGGQGAPLVPIFHQQLLTPDVAANFVVNIGGIANITFLPEQDSTEMVLGFDTGPGNALLDDWFTKHHAMSRDKFDRNGAWATKGNINPALLTQFMQDKYIKAMPPKSTGREYFHLAWLEQQLSDFTGKSTIKTPEAVDVQATLLAFTAHSISEHIIALSTQGQVYLCGGGVHNSALVNGLKERLNSSTTAFDVNNIAVLGLDGDTLEAMAFAWLAYAFDHKLESNMPAVTGASASCTLGSAFLP
ncbi:MAG: anhydro-N-acetylmuramic acid kinase [Colwellia sp.]